MNDHSDRLPDPFLSNYQPSDLRIASEFLTTWLPFLSKDLCRHCTQTLSRRVRSLDLECHGGQENSDGHNTGSIESDAQDDNYTQETFNEDNCETNSIGSWKVSEEKIISNGVNRSPEHLLEASTSEGVCETPSVESLNNRMSWADMAQEDELEEVEEQGSNDKDVYSNDKLEEDRTVKVPEKPKLSREQRENIRFMNVKRNKEFRCYEKVNNKLVNILEGLELHTGIFSAAEQKRIVNFVYSLQEMGERGELTARTYSAPRKWMRGKGRVTIQFGCCYNYAVDKNGNPPGILHNEMVDPIPDLFKVIIRRMVKWHVLPPTCVPDSCIVNIYEEGDCIPPHIDNHDFVRPFCTVSFLSECNIVFGTNIQILGAGEFAGSYSIPLPVGSVLVLNGNGADVAKHCVPAVPMKRISITFRRMDESKHPVGYHPEPDLQGIQPLAYQVDKSKRSNERKPDYHRKRSTVRRESMAEARGSTVRNSNEPRQAPPNRRRYRVNLGN